MAITWNNMPGPNVHAGSQLMQSGQNQIQQSFEGFKNLAQEQGNVNAVNADTLRGRNTDEAIARLTGITDPNEFNAQSFLQEAQGVEGGLDLGKLNEAVSQQPSRMAQEMQNNRIFTDIADQDSSKQLISQFESTGDALGDYDNFVANNAAMVESGEITAAAATMSNQKILSQSIGREGLVPPPPRAISGAELSLHKGDLTGNLTRHFQDLVNNGGSADDIAKSMLDINNNKDYDLLTTEEKDAIAASATSNLSNYQALDFDGKQLQTQATENTQLAKGQIDSEFNNKTAQIDKSLGFDNTVELSGSTSVADTSKVAEELLNQKQGGNIEYSGDPADLISDIIRDFKQEGIDASDEHIRALIGMTGSEDKGWIFDNPRINKASVSSNTADMIRKIKLNDEVRSDREQQVKTVSEIKTRAHHELDKNDNAYSERLKKESQSVGIGGTVEHTNVDALRGPNQGSVDKYLGLMNPVQEQDQKDATAAAFLEDTEQSLSTSQEENAALLERVDFLETNPSEQGQELAQEEGGLRPAPQGEFEQLNAETGLIDFPQTREAFDFNKPMGEYNRAFDGEIKATADIAAFEGSLEGANPIVAPKIEANLAKAKLDLKNFKNTLKLLKAYGAYHVK